MGFWKDDLERDKYITVYHGTHVRNIESVEENGINREDPRTGMISVAIGPHGIRVAHAYAGMSSSGGEHLFRQPGANPQHVPHEHRVVFAAKLPKDWVMKHMDPDLGGNSRELKQKFVDREAGDFLPTETPELRLRKPIPPEFITAKYINRKLVEENMSQIQEFFKSPPPEQPPSNESDKTNESFLGFKEFIEALVEEGIPNNNASSGNVKNFDPVLPIGNKPVQKRSSVLDALRALRKFLRYAELKPSMKDIPDSDPNRYGMPHSAARDTSSVGVPGLP